MSIGFADSGHLCLTVTGYEGIQPLYLLALFGRVTSASLAGCTYQLGRSAHSALKTRTMMRTV